eukprot:TRINITY_DN11383_c0_g1_i12.p1 TRINITY_DN11383_c0_g1~~TRINITY_DN11383_c0_g1_i12.p1  ORF type:complete len:489 (+),score=108.60 TRINITY_DN11383_c0_g1_i12:172-1638(+)
MSDLEAIEQYMATTERVGAHRNAHEHEQLSEEDLDEDASPWQAVPASPPKADQTPEAGFKPGTDTPSETPTVETPGMVFPPSDPRSLAALADTTATAPQSHSNNQTSSDEPVNAHQAAVQTALASAGPQDVFGVRWIPFQGHSRPILCQNSNGPCPLLAVCNILFLQQRLELPLNTDHVVFDQLVQMLSLYLLDEDISHLSEEQRANRDAAMTSLLDIFPRLLQGLDVNLKFDSTDSFEFTPELAVFDLFHIPLRHGWLVDPQETEVYSILCDKSYNQAVCLIAEQREGEDPGAALQSQQWLETNRTQLSYHGLSELNATVAENALNVFFRNNHFNVIYKHQGQLLLLVTDQAFAGSAVVWETLDNVENDGQFLDAKFNVTQDAGHAPPLTQDEILAAKLQQDEYASAQAQQQQQSRASAEPVYPPVAQAAYNDSATARQGESDEDLARRLQQQEHQQAQQQRQHPAHPPRRRPQQTGNEKKGGCIIS